MGLGDRIAGATDKNQTGMVPEVCDGCPYRGDGRLKRCGQCGCPTLNGFPLQKLGMTPAKTEDQDGCPREVQHNRRDQRFETIY